MILDKEIYKKVEYYLYNYDTEGEELAMLQEDIIHGVSQGYTEGGRSSIISNKTYNSAVKLADRRIEEKEKWLAVVDAVLQRFSGTDYAQIIDLTYIKQYRLPKILRLAHMEKTAYYDRKNDIITYAALKATEKGLVTH